MKKYDILDLTKVILCIMVIAIHTNLFPMALYPWLRLAVPMFFIISSYLLFTKIKNSAVTEKSNIIKHYITRLIKMYLFWFIVLLPITIYVRREWFNNGLVEGILNMIVKPFIGSTFIASWYIAASIIGTLIVDKLCSKINYKIVIPLFIFAYLICCGTSSYSFILENLNDNNLFACFEPHTSFVVGLIYILFGKIIAENKINIDKKHNLIIILLLCILLYIEWFMVYKASGSYNNDCYILLMPTAIFIFNYIRDINITIKHSKEIRQFSNFTYPLHASLARLITSFNSKYISSEIINGVASFMITLMICILIFIIVKKMENKIRILKYSY